jgi:hypothetical protein
MLKKLFFYLLMLGFTLVLLEGLAFVVAHLVDQDDFFDSRQSVFARLTDADLAKFKVQGGDAVTGWHSPGPYVRQEDNCLGVSIEYRYDAAGARLHDGFDAQQTEIIVVGDSYSNGDEVTGNETYPAKLAQGLGVSVANHGVGGYGPVQSLLNLQHNIARYPQAKVVVLGIMYENLHRMMNSYRPVLYSKSSDYTLKPHMSGGQLVLHPGERALENLEQFRPVADKAFDNDFWAKPVAGFPYLLTLGKSLSSNYFYYRKLQGSLRKLGRPEYFLTFEADEIRMNLIALLNQYASQAREWGAQPVAIFIPRNRLDTSSASEFIAHSRADIDAGLLLGDVAAARDIDWDKFNQQEEGSDNSCHPSPYGYQAIADYIAQLMRQNNAWPLSRADALETR